MLDSSRSRGTVPLRLQALAGTAMMFVAFPLTGLRIVPIMRTASPPLALEPVTVMAVVTPPVITAASKPQSQSRADTTFEKTLAVSPGERITLDLPTGGEVIVQSWDQPRVRVRSTLSGNQWNETRVDFQRASGGVELRASVDRRRRDSRNSNRFELWVPRRFDIRLKSAGGGLRIDGVEGTFSGETGGGSIVITNAKGRASLSTGGGEIHLSSSHLDGRVSTGGGEAVVSAVTGDVRVSSGSGPVIRTGQSDRVIGIGGNAVSVAGGQPLTVIDGRIYSSAFSLSKAGGSVNLDAVPTGGTISTGGGDINIGSSGGTLSVTTGGGDIELGRVAGDVSASTGAGNVTISVIDANGNARSIDVRSGTGGVVVELPANLDARFDVETAYTERHGPTRIRSDFIVDVTETTDWDDRQGTPRRYVRATGSSGSGRGLIRIRTVNGDVVIRRR